MSKAKMTLIGLEKYMVAHSSSLFDMIEVPESLDKDLLINSIMIRCSEFELLYSNPEFFHDAIIIWFKKHYRTFDKWMNALSIEYNPLENYDRIEDWTDTGELSGTASSVNQNSRSAFDSEEFKNDTLSDSTTKNANKSDTHHVGRLHGNIGVTTSQQMLEAELEIARWNVYDQIADLFATDFCIMVY